VSKAEMIGISTTKVLTTEGFCYINARNLKRQNKED